MLKNPLFSVLLPTRQRHDTLFYAIKTLTHQAFDDVEFVIVDNFSSTETELVVKSFKDLRIKYFRTDSRLSMTENWEYALTCSKGQYINILGDDDGLLPNALLDAKTLLENTNSEILSWFRWPYFWPSASDVSKSSSLYITLSKQIQLFYGKETLARFYQSELGFEYLPMLYNSFVSRAVIERVCASNNGQYFSDLCFSPDIYSGIVNAYFCESYIFSIAPFSLSGISNHSNGMSVANPKHNASPAQKFMAEHKRDPKTEMVHSFLPKSLHPGILLVSDQLRIKEQFFINDESIKLDFLKLLRMMASGLHSDSQHYSYHYDAVVRIAQKVGIELGCIDIPAPPPTVPSSNRKYYGWTGNPENPTNAIVDCSAFQLMTIEKACSFFGLVLSQEILPQGKGRDFLLDPATVSHKLKKNIELVTIAIPTYNRIDSLKKSVQSALNQDYDHIEIVISDNASSDETYEFCRELELTDSRIRYIRNAENVGGVRNFELSLAASQGDFFMWLGDDDWLDSNYVSSCLTLLNSNPDCILTYGQAQYISQSTGKLLYKGRNFSLEEESSTQRVLSYYQAVSDNGIFYGLMRREYISQLRFQSVMGGDWLLIASMAFWGKLSLILKHQSIDCTKTSKDLTILKKHIVMAQRAVVCLGSMECTHTYPLQSKLTTTFFFYVSTEKYLQNRR
ncbi:MAG: glycosyltransferase [Coleofasciculaceae cyanobacterium RL_1_1]|nr:glycosyltransferase [Coleofasciculaceae cyanobacterium RL_1_1]